MDCAFGVIYKTLYLALGFEDSYVFFCFVALYFAFKFMISF